MTSRIRPLLFAALLGPAALAATPPAFPGALGFGAIATGGRGGSVYHVTNLDDSGAGSFRDAVSTSGRIVVFDVGGTIQLETAVSIASNITVAGQSAPGGGIAFRGGELSCAKKSNIILRHLRIRPGSETADDEDDALSLYLADKVILDHCSFEFAPWNNIDGVGTSSDTVTNITFQRSLIADPIGQQFGAHCESIGGNWAWYFNAFANSHNRNPLAKTNTVFVNNVEYNNEASYTTHTSTSFRHDIVNNYFVYGPSSEGNTWYQVDKNQSIYYSGNLLDTDMDGTLDGSTTTPYWYQGTGTVLSSPWSTVTSNGPLLTTATAYRHVVSQSGAQPWDSMDSLIWSQVKTLGYGTAGPGVGTSGPSSLYTSQTQTGLANNGYGTVATGTRATDTDNDGMPDWWEKATGSDTAKDDAMTLGSDGYAAIENYLNWLAEPHARTSGADSLDVDLAACTGGFSTVSPSYAVVSARGGTAALRADGHTVRFVPSSTGRGLLTYSVAGSDGSGMTDSIQILAEGSTDQPPAFTTPKSFSIPENTVAVATVAATDPEGGTVAFAIAGGDDSAAFAIDAASGVLVFRTAPDWENPTDEGLDNIYKVIVSASDGKATAKQSIAVLVTDVAEGTTGLGDGASRVAVPVVWIGLDGSILGRGKAWIDPERPRPAVPATLRGVGFARLELEGGAMVVPVAAP